MSGLYPVTVINTVSPSDIYAIDQGSLIAFPFSVQPNQVLGITVTHLALGVQDHSIRCWVSHANDAGGVSLGDHLNTEFWHPNRTPTESILVHDRATVVDSSLAIGVDPGDYVVNVLNMVNSRNVCSIVIAEISG